MYREGRAARGYRALSCGRNSTNGNQIDACAPKLDFVHYARVTIGDSRIKKNVVGVNTNYTGLTIG